MHSRPGEQASETPSVEILHRETAIRFLGSVSARLLAAVRALLRRFDCYIDRSDYIMGDINNTHGGGAAAASATFPVAMYVLFLSYLALLLVPYSDLMHVLNLMCMAASMLLLSLSFTWKALAPYSGTLAVFGTILYVLSFALGAGPVPVLLLPEIFASRIRAKAVALSLGMHKRRLLRK
ncbi:hypothetical protein QYE76_049009 [Lolium multiflorum]|uniref:Sugar transporter n=1 Tax=Lolium multiflorum TaxID=4521 RepID=A0AAD8WHX2_LOLMU|nr:hypothetical protein QYE76_049009 [Lolium multiflorum]